MAYWRDREEANQREYLLIDDEYVDRLQDIYDYTLDQIQREINGFYTKYMTAENITYAEATKRVSQLDIDEYQRKAKEYVANRDFSAKANAEMRLYNTTMKINRLELLKSEIGLELVNGFMVIDDEMKADLTERALAEFERQAGILGTTVQNRAEAANSIVNASFRNATFSDRIWMYQSQLKSELDFLLRQGLIQGWNPNELARHLDRLFDAGKYNCERLMRTELTRVQTDAQLQSFTANGFDWYQFNALGTACEACRELDEQHFKVIDAMVGENLPPIHPNCRCAVSAWMDDALYQEWLDSYANHGMSYADWLENKPTAVDQTATFNGEYLRFGEIPENEQSVNFTKLTFDESRRVGDWNFTVPEEAKEAGVSVFRLDQDGLPIIDNINLAKDLGGRIGEKTAYIVSGNVVGIGQDGEPLLSNVTIKKEGAPSNKELASVIDKFLRSEFKTVTSNSDEDYTWTEKDGYGVFISYTSYYQNPETGEIKTGWSQPKGWIDLGQKMTVSFTDHDYTDSIYGEFYKYPD